MHISPATIPDYESLVHLYAHTLTESMKARGHACLINEEIARTQILHAIIGEDQRVIVAKNDRGEYLGFLTFGIVLENLAPNGITGEIYRLYVHPSAWGQKIGEKLMKAATKTLREFGHKNCLAWVPADLENSIKWYEKQGWEKTEIQRPDMDGVPINRICMTRALDS